MKTYTVRVQRICHANCDSLPLRFGIHFEVDQDIVLTVKNDLGPDIRYPDRFHVEANFRDPTNLKSPQHFGYFVLEQRPHDAQPSLVTVWRGDRNTEYGLSTTMRSLREAGFVTVNQLLDMHPLYKSGTVCDSPGLVKYLSTSIAKTEIQRFENVASKAKDETAQAIKAMEAAIAKEAHSRSVAMEAIAVVDQLEEKAVAQQAEIDELRTKIKADEAKYLVESANAKLEGNVATLSDAKTLETVHEGVLISGSLCTVLVMSDKRELKMKTLTFDKDGSITRKAISYIGKRVKTTCWDPIGQPGKWSSKGYFRNVFLTE